MDNMEKKYNVTIHTIRGNLYYVVDVPVEVAEDEDHLADFMGEYASIVAQENEGVACEEVEYEEVV